MARIETIDYNASEGRLREIYDEIISKRGKLADVHMIQSLNPESIVHHMDLYMTIMYSKSPLKRYQREMVAVIVSIANNCEYCSKHHVDALNHYWKSDEKCKQLKLDYKALNLSKQDALLCEVAAKLTKTPGPIDFALLGELKESGLDDRGILDLTMVVAYFNFVNRIVGGLAVELEEDSSGFNY